ncbi:MAG TPA: hypothetical protein VJU82_08270 [Acidobacteriaceae bacterium]|nr:hypothetical protein [Acidobacteriaceae bacterium]
MPAKRTNTVANHAAKRLVHPGDEQRRAYEHLGRIEILEGALAGSPFVDVAALANLAQQQLGAGHSRNAADLLRSAEYLCFAALAPGHVTDSLMNPELKRAITVEFETLMRQTEEQWQEDEPANRHVIDDLFTRALDQARRAFARGAFRPALEFARAAEALSCIREGLPATLPDRGLTGRLAS